MPTIKLVVFDMAGTTVYDGDAVNRCLSDALRAADITVTRDQVNAVMGLPKPVAIRMLLSDAADTNRVQAIYADFLTRMLAFYQNDPNVREIPGASETFHRLRSAGVKVALDTGFSRPIADAVLARLGWTQENLLDATVTSDEVAQGRPHPDLIYRAMALAGITEAADVAKVGDTPSDLLEGQAAGCGLVIGVIEGSHTVEQLSAYPHTHLIHSVIEIPALILGAPSA